MIQRMLELLMKHQRKNLRISMVQAEQKIGNCKIKLAEKLAEKRQKKQGGAENISPTFRFKKSSN